jgi:hypothetical protein
MYTYAQSQVKEQLFYYFFAYCVILLHKQSRVCHVPINTVNLKYVNLRPYIFKVGYKFLMYRRNVYVVFVFLLYNVHVNYIHIHMETILTKLTIFNMSRVKSLKT